MPSGDKTDGPLATFKAVQKAIRELKQGAGGSKVASYCFPSRRNLLF